MEKQLNKRYFTLDIARVIAIFCVVIVHSSADLVSLYRPGAPAFLIGNVINGSGRIALPLFLMISGALFLDEKKNVTLKGILKRNVKPLVLIALFWSTVYAGISVLNGQSTGIKNFIRGILYGPYQIWYLYMISLIYIAIPFIRKFVNKHNANMVLIFIAVSLSTKFSIPVIQMLCKLGINVKFVGELINRVYPSFFDGHIAYFLAGWYIVHVGIKKKWVRFAVYALGIMALAATILYVQLTAEFKYSYHHLSLLVFMFSVALFLALNTMKLNPKEKMANLVTWLSKLSFGVYIVHVMVLDFCKKYIPGMGHPVLYVLILFVAVTAGSYLLSFLISKIPVLKKSIKA